MSAPGNVPADSYDQIERLLTRSLSGDHEALAELYDATAPRVLGLVSRILGPGQLAEDVAARVYERIWARKELAPRGAGLPWLIDLARHTALTHRRTRVPRQRGAGDTSPVVALDPDWMPELDPEERAALDLLYLHGFTVAETDERLGWLPGTTVLVAHRAMLHLVETFNAQEVPA